jgi:putative transposase
MGVQNLKKGKRSYRPDSTTFNLVIVEDETGIKRSFATNLNMDKKDAFSLFNLYDKRWGIETSYRVKGEFKPKTTSKNYVVRLFYFLFSVYLYNLWVLASLFIGAILGKFIIKRPLITAKVFGTLLYTYWMMEDRQRPSKKAQTGF